MNDDLDFFTPSVKAAAALNNMEVKVQKLNPAFPR